MQQVPDTGQQTSPSPRRRTSSIPRPTLQTNIDNHHSNALTPSISSPQSSTGINNFKTRRAEVNGAGPTPIQSSAAARSFDAPSPRAVTTPVLKSAVSSPHVNRQKGADKASFRDLVARFNQSQTNHNIPLGPQRPTPRSASNYEPTSSHIPQTSARRREPQSAVERPSPLLSSLQNTVDRVNTGSGSFGYDAKASSEPRNGQQPRRRSVQRDQDPPPVRRDNPPLFGEIIPGDTQWPNGFGIHPPSNYSDGSDEATRQQNPLYAHSRSISDISSPRTPTLQSAFTHTNGESVDHTTPRARSRSDQASRTIRSPQRDAPYSPIIEDDERVEQGSPGRPPSQSRIPVPRSHGRNGSRDVNHYAHDTYHHRPSTPPSQHGHSRQWSGSSPEKHTGQSLHAIINVPSLTTSPPLRSSRPRRSIDQARSVSPDAGRSNWDTSSEAASRKRNASFSSESRAGTHAHDNISGSGPDSSRQAQDPSYMLQLPTTTYQRPDRGLKINVEDTTISNSFNTPSTANTHFEEDDSPATEMPGTFPVTGDSPAGKSSGLRQEQSEDRDEPSSLPNGILGQLGNRSRTVLSQIMEMRRNRDTAQFPIDPSPTAARSSLATQTDAGTIQIMLDEPPAHDQTQSGWYNREPRYQVDQPGLSNATNNLSPSQTAEPSGANSPGSQSGIDGDYSAISRILDQYHQSGIVSPAMIHEFQQYILDVDPDLLGTDEAEKESVAKTALEDIIRDHASRSQHSRTVDGANEDDQSLDDSRPSLSYPNRDSLASSDAVRSATDNDEVAATRPMSDGAADQDEAMPESTAPTPPPKDHYLTPRSHDPYSTASPIAAQGSSTSLPVDRPRLPKTPITGGSIGFSPAGALLSEDPNAQQPDNNGTTRKLNESFTEDVPAIMQPDVPYQEQDAALLPAAHNLNDTYDTSFSTPASSMRDAPSISDSQHTPSSKTSVMDSTTSEQTLAPTSSSSAGDAEQKRLNRRRQVLKELLDTEASYIQDMKVVEDIYKTTSESCIAVSQDDRRVLFGNCDVIIKFSERFLSSLKKAAVPVYVMPRNNKWRADGRGGSFSTSNSAGGTDEDPTGTSSPNDDDKDRKTFVGDVFNQFMTEMEELYSIYLRNHDFANQRLKRLQEVPRVKMWLAECHNYASDITSAWDLDSLLVKPVQRVLKYPLLLKALIETTPDTHPDFGAIEVALKNMTEASVRINEAKKRAEVLEAMMTNTKRKDFDFSKLLGRRTDKLRQQVGLSDAVDDTEYRKLAQKFETRYVHLQIVMRDFEVYKEETQKFMMRMEVLMNVVEENIAVGRSETPELESKWRKLVTTFREMNTYAWRDHDADVTKRCTDPILTVIKLYDGPSRMMMKRKKRTVEYAKYMTARNKGEKLDKKTSEQGEQFMALNETLKTELPRLFELSNQLVETCLRSFTNLQLSWASIWQRKMRTILEDPTGPVPEFSDILDAFNSDFNYVEGHVLSLGICNGAVLNEINNYLSSSGASFTTADTTSTTRPSYQRSSAASGTQSPRIPVPDFDRRSGSGFNIPAFSGRTSNESQHRPQQQHSHSYQQDRFRANSNLSNTGRTSQEPATPTPYVPHSESRQQRAAETRPAAFQQSSWQQQQPPPPPQQSQPSPPQVQPDSRVAAPPPYSQPTNAQRPMSASTFYSAAPGPSGSTPNLSQQRQHADAFSSALPMTESRPVTPEAAPGQREPRVEYKVLFTAASLYDFNLKQDRYEAGYPYLFYAPGEIFDVIGTKGELWLARNQDDRTGCIGWVWEKHFAKLGGAML